MSTLLLFRCTLGAAALLGCAFAGSFLLRKISAALRHFLWTAAMVCVALLPVFPKIPLRLPIGTPRLSSARAANGAGQRLSRVPSLIVEAVATLPARSHGDIWLPLLWLAGAAAHALRLANSLRALKRRVGTLLPCSSPAILAQALACAREFRVARPVRILLQNSADGMPWTFGLFRPLIVLPADCTEWSAHRLRLVLLHEMAHVRRRDWAVGIFAQFVLTVYWFHPLVWMASRRLREESECAADDFVLNTGESAHSYAGELLTLIRASRSRLTLPAVAVPMARPHQLERRITRMLNETKNRRRLTAPAILSTTTAGLVALIALSALQSPAQDPAAALTGIVLGPDGAAVPTVTVIATGKATGSRDMTVSDARGSFRFDALPAGEYEVRFLKPGFSEFRESAMLPVRDNSAAPVKLELGSLSETVTVRGVQSAPESTAPSRIVVAGPVQAANLVTKIRPLYPKSARTAGVQGAVILEATIGADGIPNSLQVMNSHIDPDLARAAVVAVNQWRYQPTLLNGQPVEVRTNITVNFTLAN